jgi:hypothetical protein
VVVGVAAVGVVDREKCQSSCRINVLEARSRIGSELLGSCEVPCEGWRGLGKGRFL